MKLLAAHVRACQVAMGVKDLRWYLNWVYIAPNGDMVATDGHRITKCAGSVSAPDAYALTDEQRLFKIIGLGKSDKIIDIVPGDKTCVVTDRRGKDRTLVVEYCTEEYRYPEYDRVIPKCFKECDAIGINVKYLADLTKVFDGVAGSFNGVKLRFACHGGGSIVSLIATSESPDYHGVIHLITPCRL